MKRREPRERYFLDNGKGKPCLKHTGELSRFIGRHCKEIGLTGIKPLHGIRAAGATQLLRSGVDIRSVQLLLDHESIQTTAHYDDRENELQRDALSKLSFV